MFNNPLLNPLLHTNVSSKIFSDYNNFAPYDVKEMKDLKLVKSLGDFQKLIHFAGGTEFLSPFLEK